MPRYTEYWRCRARQWCTQCFRRNTATAKCAECQRKEKLRRAAAKRPIRRRPKGSAQ
ncbi:MAG: hypothetical protein OXG90_12965 [Gammaproteobacteria bacterium]|nr:hypothetical protein [Gammaproteobacteria bacterium]